MSSSYSIDNWSEGYFRVDSQGELNVHPTQTQHSINLPSLLQELQHKKINTPLLLRFADIIKHRVQSLCDAFNTAINTHNYEGHYTAVYPIKVNQERCVVETIINSNQIGLEAGSKPELLAVLASARPNTKIICNGYKDRKFIRLALISQQLGHPTYIIIEKFSELKTIIEESKSLNVKPLLGVRIRLASIGKGNWQNTGGEKSKFGLSATQVLQLIDELQKHNLLNALQLLHAHIGSQVANIRDIQRGTYEIAQYYAQLRNLGAPIDQVDLGGGLGIDYEGTNSRSACSINYSITEYANKIIDTFATICNKHTLPHPNLITESGRAMVAHHAVLITDIIDTETKQAPTQYPNLNENTPQPLLNLANIHENISQASLAESYHDATYNFTDIQNNFIPGLVTLEQRAHAEQLYYAICEKIKNELQPQIRAHREILDELNQKLASKVYCNFSIFQSIPDVWGIDQVFPIMPITHLHEPTNDHAVLRDITCDSDGRIDWYVNENGLEPTLPLPAGTQHLAIFLVGAYQEFLGDMHNLFGETNVVHVSLTPENRPNVTQFLPGNTAADVLSSVHYELSSLKEQLHSKLASTSIHITDHQSVFDELCEALDSYTYLDSGS